MVVVVSGRSGKWSQWYVVVVVRGGSSEEEEEEYLVTSCAPTQ